MFVTNWISTTKIQKISEITNFFRHYFLSRTEVKLYTHPKRKKQEPAIKLFLAFFDFMLQLLGDYYLLVGILNSLTLEMDFPS